MSLGIYAFFYAGMQPFIVVYDPDISGALVVIPLLSFLVLFI
jgi:hypothetical protein